MKQTFILILVVMFSLSSFAQKNDRKERVKALKIAFLTERLALTESEAQKFWPVYNKFDDSYNALRHEMRSERKNLDIDQLDEQAARRMIDEMVANENEKSQLKQNFIKDLLKILPAKKIVQLKEAEDAFNKRMFEEYKKRKANRQK